MANLIKEALKAVLRPDCHARLECALKEAKANGFTIDRQAALSRMKGGPIARPSTR